MLPTSLEAATVRMMRPDSIAREPEMLGDVFVEHYGGTREHEVKLWNEAVTSWEGIWFFSCTTLDTSDFRFASGALPRAGVTIVSVHRCLCLRLRPCSVRPINYSF